MEELVQIKEVGKLLEPLLDKNQKIVNLAIKSLVAPGENYGSYLLDLTVTLSDQQILRLVAKMCPPNSFLKELFCVLVSAKKEIAMYKTIFPTLTEFSEELDGKTRITFLPKYYGSRLNLKFDSDEIDDDAVLLLENLKISGYTVMDRIEGLNFKTSNLLMRNLAVFHAVPIAFKLLRPNDFSSKILPHLVKVSTVENLSKESYDCLVDMIINTARNVEKIKPLMERFEKAIRNCGEEQDTRCMKEKFATFNHNDFWVNNAMIKFQNGDPVDCKILDFQLLTYGSVGKDVVFFLSSSVQTEVFYRHYDDLIQTYYDSFISTLNDFKCDVTGFTLENLKTEMEVCAKTSEFFHLMYMINPIFSPKGTVKNMTELTEHDLVTGTGQLLSDIYSRKLEEKTLQFAHMNWI